MNNTTSVKPLVTTKIPFLPLGMGLLIVCVLGLLGNILSALVLMRPKMNSTYSILTLGLTFCDTAYLITKLLRYGLQSLFLHFSIAEGYTDVFYPLVTPGIRAIGLTAHTGSTYFTMAVAIDRYISVCKPYKARILCTKNRAILSTGLVLIFSVLYNLPRWWEFHTKKAVEYEGNTTILTNYSMEQSALRDDKDYQLYYVFWAYFFVMFFIPFASLSVFNLAIWRAMRRLNQKREVLTSRQKRETSYAIMLFSVVIVFLLCSVDYLIVDLLIFFGKSYHVYWDYLGNFLITLNSAVNFLIYCTFGRRFREEFTKICGEGVCCPRQKKKEIKIDISCSGNESRDDTMDTEQSNFRNSKISNRNTELVSKSRF